MSFHRFDVAMAQRAVVLRHGQPIEALGPGRHWRFGFGLSLLSFDTRGLVFDALPAVREVLPAGWYDRVDLGDRERAVVRRGGVPRIFLRPGRHCVWAVDPEVEVEVFSVDHPMPTLTDELRAIVPAGEYVDVLVEAHEAGLQFVDGTLVAKLPPGRYTLWSHPDARVRIQSVDLRRQDLQLAGQDLMTRDKVSLRLTLSCSWSVHDPAAMVRHVASPRDALYLAIQLAAHEYVASATLDALLEGREALTTHLAQVVVPKAERLGLTIHEIGLKDVVLPGEMKALLNRVIEAEKEAAANVILRREETAATRSLANTAKVMADNPTLLRLKELEAVKDIAGQIDEVRLVVGSDGLEKLALGELLGRAK